MTVKNQEVQKTQSQAVEGDAERIAQQPVYVPPADIYERNDALVVVADMPGATEKDVEVRLDNNVLTIAGRAEFERPEGFDDLYSEFEAGRYERVFTLSEDINREGIKATMKNGVLRVELPKSEKVRPRKIAVQAE